MQDIDSTENNGYNNIVENANVGGGENAIHQQRGMDEGGGEYRAIDSGRKGETRRTWQENEETFTTRNERNQAETGRTKRILLKHGNAQMAYTSAEAANDKSGGRAVQILHNIGINAEYADGDIETNAGNITTAHTQAFTAPDGTVYVSSNATLSDIEIAAHESVHANDVLGTMAYVSYQAVIKDNIRWNSESYRILSQKINEAYNSENMDVYSENFGAKFVREIAAYINQFVVTDLEFATQQFSDLFYDWDAVVEASQQFNKDIGADFSESASLMPKNSNLQSTAEDALGITEPDISKDTRSEAEQMAEMVGGTENQKAKARRFVQDLGNALGVKVVFEDTVSKLGYFSDGYIDSKKVIHIDYANKNPIAFLFRHEMVHYGSGSKFYKQFVKLVYNSKQFEQWLLEKTKMPEGSSVERMAAKYMTMTAKAREGIESLSEPELQEEMVADFAGSDIFANGGSGLKAISTDVSIKQRNAVSQWIADFISWIKKKINKVQGADKLTFELSRIEDSFNRMISDAKQNPTENKLKHSVAVDADGKYVKINTNQNFFEGKTISEKQKIARKIILENFKGKVLSVGDDGKAYINKRSAEEYAYPANRRMDNSIKDSKMRASAELDNILLVSEFIGNESDDGRHLDATGGWNKYSTRFEVNNEMFEGEVIVKVTDKGKVFYDITKIKRTARKAGQAENNSAAASGNPSINSITHNKSTVNTNSMQEKENNSQDKIRRSVPVIESETDTTQKPEILDYAARHKELFVEAKKRRLTHHDGTAIKRRCRE